MCFAHSVLRAVQIICTCIYSLCAPSLPAAELAAAASHLPQKPVSGCPTLGAWRALVRGRVPARLLVDWQLLAGDPTALAAAHPLLLTPPRTSLPARLQAALAAYGRAGGRQLEVREGAWHTAAARPALEAALLASVFRALGPPRVRLAGGPPGASLPG